MRAIDGQRSDRVVIKRSTEEKRRLLVQLREQLAVLKPTVAPTIRESITQRIAELEQELAQPGAQPAQKPRGGTR